MKLIEKSRAAILRLRCRRGVAMLEFGLAMPLLMILGLGGLELINYVIVQMQVNRIAVMTADNASRLRTQMSESYINQLFVGVEKAGANIDFKDHGRVILSSIQNNNGYTGQWIRWQRCFGDLPVVSKYGAQDKGNSDSSLPDMNGLQAQAGSAIMYVELAYDYQPLFGRSLFGTRRMTREAGYIVRQRTDFSISGSTPSLCT